MSTLRKSLVLTFCTSLGALALWANPMGLLPSQLGAHYSPKLSLTGGHDKGRDLLSLIPSTAQALIDVRRSADFEEGSEAVTRQLLNATDLLPFSEDFVKALAGTGQTAPLRRVFAAGADRNRTPWQLVVAQLPADRTIAEDRTGDAHLVALSPQVLAYAQPPVLEALRSRWNEGGSAQGLAAHLARADEADVRMALTPGFLGFAVEGSGQLPPAWSLRSNLAYATASISWADLGEKEIRFRSRIEFSEEGNSEFLAAALQQGIPSGRGTPIAKAASQAEIRRGPLSVEFSMDLPSKALANLPPSRAAKRLLRWQNIGLGRERWQKVDEIFQEMGVKPGSRVADVGAGAGFLTYRLARAVGRSGRVWAVDVRESSLEKLREQSRQAGLDQVEAVLGADDDPRLPDSQVEAVVMVDAYHEMPEYESMLENIAKALVAGGRLVIIDNLRNAEQGLSRQAQMEKHSIAPEIVEEDLRKAGFKILRRDDGFVTQSSSQWLIVAQFQGR